MRPTLATRFSIAVVGIVVLAAASSLLTLVLMGTVGRIVQGAIANNVSSVRAANELEIALLRQGGILFAYHLDHGNPQYLRELNDWEAEFEKWLATARSAAHTPEEETILRDLVEAYRAYDAKRDEAVALIGEGHDAKAKAVLLHEIKDLSSTFAILSGLCGLTESVQEELFEAGGDFFDSLAEVRLCKKCFLPE